ncbi:hypothetical protein QVM21_21995 [Pseudomonas aeruginosa]
MMAAIDFLRDQGFTVRKVGARVVVGPRGKITDDIRSYVKRYRLALLAELAANDGIERRAHWRVCLPDCRPFVMVGEPCTHAEALAHAQGIWPDAEVEP